MYQPPRFLLLFSMERGDTLAAGIGRSRARVWLRRYLPAEIVGTSAALAGAAFAARGGTGDAVVAASWAEAIAFYVFVTGRELWRARGPRLRSGAIVAAVRDVVAEFGVAELADTIFLRPLLMYAFVQPLGGLIPGVIVGKLVADLLFYGLAIPAYELRERARR
jgi:hypothetical protein